MKDPNKNRKSGTEDRLREISDGYEVPFNETAWEKMENLLEPEKPNRSPKFFTLKIITVMILFLSLLYFTFTTINQPEVNKNANISIAEESALNTTEKETLNLNEIDNTPKKEIEENLNPIPKKPKTPKPNQDQQNAPITAPIIIDPPLVYKPPFLPSVDIRVPFAIKSPADIPATASTMANDSSFFQMLNTLLSDRQEHFQPEKVYLQLDRPFYKPGEGIWFNVFLRDAITFKPSKKSDIVYVELISPNGKVLQKRNIITPGGSGAGDFGTDVAMAGGTYKIKAYTLWQENTETFFEREIQIQNTVLPRLRMELDFAREAYGPGDMVKAYLNLNTLENSVLKNHAFQYLVNLDGQQIAQANGQTNETGKAQIAFQLPTELKTIDGLVNVMIAYNGQTESIARSVPIVLNNIDLQFFPEGGNAIAGLDGKMGFKAINELGKPADVEGVILNETSQVVASFKSYHMGMGAFQWKPEAGETYTAKITKPIGVPANYELPEVSTRGYALEVLEQSEEELLINISSTENEALYLIAQSRDKIYETRITPKKSGVHTLSIPTAEMPLGIAQVTLFDSREIPRAERLVFLNPNKKLDIQVTTDKERYQPREKVKMKIEVKDDRGLPVPGKFSLSVVDDNLLTYADDKQGHLLAAFLLESELKGDIEEPNFYFDPPKVDDGKDRALALDYLMLTQGWRRFDWVEVMNEEMALMEKPGEKVLISGLVIDNSNVPVSEGYEVNIEGTDYKTTTDPTGFFTFQDVDFIGEEMVVNAKKGKIRGVSVRKSNNDYILPPSPNNEPILLRKKVGTGNKISGRVFEESTGESLIGASILEQGTTNGVITDLDGNFEIICEKSPVILMVSYTGYQTIEQTLVLQNGYDLIAEIGMEDGGVLLDAVVVTGYKVPLIEKDNTSSGGVVTSEQIRKLPSKVRKSKNKKRKNGKKQGEKTPLPPQATTQGKVISAEEIRNLPTKNINSVAATAIGLKATDDGDISVRGSRKDDQVYYIDGVRVRGGKDKRANKKKEHQEKEKLAEFDLVDEEILEEAPRQNIHYQFSYYRARQFYAPKYEAKEKQAQRTDFRSTIYWNPAINIDRDGKGEVEFYNSDDISTFKTIIEGIGIDGSLGRAVQTHYTQLPFGMDIKVPANVLTGDHLKLPLALSNNTASNISGKLKVDLPAGFTLKVPFAEKINIKAGETKTIFLDYQTDFEAQSGICTVAFDANGFSDAFSQTIEVTSHGFPITDMYSGKVKETTFEVEIIDPIAGSMEAVFHAYPSPLGDVSKGLDRMLRQPRGCFEQTSSCNYPNLLALDYMQSTNKVDPEVEQKALAYLDAGYKRLLSYEVNGGGFDWYGKAPAHEALTAYGLMQFVDMKAVYPVEQDLIDRTAKWLLGQRDGKGGWKSSKRGLHSWEGESPIANAYIVWAMTEAGFANKIKKEIDQSYQDAVKSEDPYLMALMLGVLESTNDNRADDLQKELLNLQEKDGSWKGLSHSMTHSKGKTLWIETSALSVLSVLKSNKAAAVLEKGIQFLAGSKSGNGFGSTQSTVLAMKALIDHAKATTGKSEDGTLVFMIDGQQIGEQAFNKNQRAPIVFPDLAKYFTNGKHQVSLRFSNKGAVLPYDLSIKYYTSLPRNKEATPLELKTELEKTQTKMGANVRLSTTLTNVSGEAVPNTIAMVGIPSGLSLQAWQLKELQERAACDYIEILDNYVAFHFLGLEQDETKVIHLDLKADIPGNYESPASVAYLYYNDDNRFWTKAKTVRVGE